ncbi:symplekin-like isoform X4 [Durio zibethinus]|uniref:Symplekin-like isoform X4 n=1 Tax=Durio zibethinus TaxID=66656 RepID=A0A6P6AUR9_DURZI|nr:symplekin-like isoform X4 [Durio zibethinus]
MVIVDSRDQALSLLTAANNHADLAVKLSSLKQAKDILSSLDSSFAADLFPYLADLQRSPYSLVRKFLIEIIEDIALKAIDHCSILVPVLVAFLRDADSDVVRQSIACGRNFFCNVLEEMVLQFQQHGKVDRWLEELWTWMVRFKEGVFSIALEPGPVGTKLLALKFLETYVLLFTADNVDSEKFVEVTRGSGWTFNVSWLSGGHPILDPVALTTDANRTLFVLLDMLQSANSLPGCVTITVVYCLAAIARKRPLHYGTVLSSLLDFNANFETMRGLHNANIQYSLRTAFLGFLRCTYPAIVESRDRLLRVLRAMNAGDAADQVIRQVEKMIKNSERSSRETQSGRDDQSSSQAYVLGDLSKKRSMPQDNEELTNSFEIVSKRIRSGPNSHSMSPTQINDSGQDIASVNGLSPNLPLSDGNLTPVEQMIAMIGALLAEGERGAESLEILISKIHPDLLADIVITNMRHLPKSPPSLTRLGALPITQQAIYVNSPTQAVPPPAPNSLHPPVSTAQLPFSSAATTSSSISNTSAANNSPADAKRDPRRDPRRLDPRRAAVSVGVPSPPVLEEDTGTAMAEFDGSISSKPLSVPVVENPPVHSMSNIRSDDKMVEGPMVSGVQQPAPEGDVLGGAEDIVPMLEVKASSNPALSPSHMVDEDSAEMKADAKDLPVLPLYVELTEEQKRNVRKSAVQQIAESYLHLHWSDGNQMHMALLARLVGQIDADDDIVVMLGKQIVVDYQQQKGHEIVLQVLYHLYSLTVSNSIDNSSYSAVLYEKFLLAVVKSLLEAFPASDKSVSRLLGEVPFLPDSALKLLDDLCYSDVFDVTGKEIRDAERVTQGLGVVWSLILGRPNNRQVCLGIALKCAVHSQDDIRGKAIRLVANKLYQLSYISGEIEQFATNMLLSAVDQHAAGAVLLKSGSIDERDEREVGSRDTSTSGSQLLEPRASEIDSMNTESTSNSASVVSFPEAQRLISLFFALCTKKPSLLQLSFDIYGRAPKIVKQAFHRHIPIVIRALGQSYSQLLLIISDPPQGSENLLTLVLQILTQETTPSPDLVATVKHLYETKLKDATILIPMLSSLSKNEVLPIFPRLVDLPLEKFQLALAHILQGSAHTGPALTPAEVLVAIHDIIPEKGGPPLKKITDACSACFEQRTVFTQQVLAKALNQMVDQIPLPLLFMRTVIQAIDAFPTLVDFVMEILSKLVSKQVWRMPKLWVGFLKCVAQTQPHSFPVLLQLPPPQLESALNKYGSLRSSLAAYASQPTTKGSLPRSTLAVLGLANDSHMQQPHLSTLHPTDNSSVQGATLT